MIVAKTVSWLVRKGLQTDGLFRESAPAVEMKSLKMQFDRGQNPDIENLTNPHLIGGLTKLYFRELPTPIFPLQVLKSFKEIIAAHEANSPERLPALRKQLALLGASQQKTVVFLFDFLTKVARNANYNQMTSYNLGICWGPTLFRTGGQAAPVVSVLIDNYDQIFRVLD